MERIGFFNENFSLPSTMNKNKLLKSIQTACCLIVMAAGPVTHIHAQVPDELKKAFAGYNGQVLQEKLFVHTDKRFYLAGEICWYKVYNTDAFFNKPLGLSKLAYIELLDKNNKPVLQSKCALKEGDGDGSLLLPASLTAGKYLLRAYTSWMKNFDAGYFFEKSVTIVNARKMKDGMALATKNKYDIQFFPEGGNLVNGIQSKVAFRVVDQNGKGVSCSGSIINERADTVASFASLKFGMGSFLFTPAAAHVYKAIIVLPDSSHNMQEMPVAYNEGYVMHLEEAGNHALKITVQTPAVSNTAPVYLFVHTRGSVKISTGSPLRNGYTEFVIDSDKLGAGISHITLFNESRQPVCERLYFKRPENHLEITTVTDQPEYEQRKKIDISVLSADQNGKTVPADMSMAVYRVDSLTRPDEMDISNYLWLTSDLRGSIESPAYYFTQTSSEVNTALDNLLLTQGWRRFNWQNILQHTLPVFRFTPEYKGHIVRGRVTSNTTGRPVRGVECFLSVAGTRTQMRGDISNDSGIVQFEMNHFYGNDEVFVQASSSLRDTAVHVEIINPYTENTPATNTGNWSMPATGTNSLQRGYVSVQVQNSYLGSKLRQQALPVFDTLPFYSQPDKVYQLDDYVRFTTIEEILREYVPYVNVRKRDGVFYLPVFDLVRKEFFQVDPLVMLDGIPIFDMNKLMAYDPLKIRRLDVVSRVYYLGNMFFGGIVNFITYTGDLQGYELDPGVTVIDYKTLQLQREFFSPVYETPEQYASRMPDFRSLLHWQPNLKTNKDGKQQTSFYTSDLSGDFAVVVQGITTDGTTGSKTIFFRVKENNLVAGKK